MYVCLGWGVAFSFVTVNWRRALSWHPTNRGWGCYELNHAAHTMICPSQHTSYSSITGPLSLPALSTLQPERFFFFQNTNQMMPLLSSIMSPHPKDKQKSKPKVWSTRCCLPSSFSSGQPSLFPTFMCFRQSFVQQIMTTHLQCARDYPE